MCFLRPSPSLHKVCGKKRQKVRRARIKIGLPVLESDRFRCDICNDVMSESLNRIFKDGQRIIK